VARVIDDIELLIALLRPGAKIRIVRGILLGCLWQSNLA